MVTVEAFEAVKPGHRVTFYPRDAIGGARGLRKRIVGTVSHIDAVAGTAQVGDFIVPLRKVRRLGKFVYRDWARAHAKAERKRVYGGLKRGEKGKLATCAQDARQASAAVCLGDYSGPMTKRVNSEAKFCRQRYMKQRGIDDTSDVGQCQALPVLLERALVVGKTPVLKGVEYLSADSGVVGIGDKVTLAGHEYKVVAYSPEGQVILKDGFEIAVPTDRIPHDKGTAVKSVLEKLAAKREQRLAKLAARGEQVIRPRPRSLPVVRHTAGKARRKPRRQCFRVCVLRDRYGRFKLQRWRNPVVSETDLLGRRVARLVGPTRKAAQIPLFEREHALTPQEKAELRETEQWRRRREVEKREGQLDLFSVALPIAGGLAIAWLLARQNTGIA